MANLEINYYENRLQEIEKMELSRYDRGVALANLMTLIETENEGISHVAVAESQIDEFYRKVRSLRDETF